MLDHLFEDTADVEPSIFQEAWAYVEGRMNEECRAESLSNFGHIEAKWKTAAKCLSRCQRDWALNNGWRK